MPSTAATRDQLLTAAEAAEYLEVRPQTLATWRCTKRYDLPYIKVGNKVRYRQRDLDRWLKRRTVGALPEEE